MSLLSIINPTPLDPALDALLRFVAPKAGSPLGKRRREADVLRQKMASAGHDLRQPLQVIGYALSRLGRNLADDGDRAWLDAAVSQTKRLADGLTDLVDAARDASGAPTSKPSISAGSCTKRPGTGASTPPSEALISRS